MAVPRLDLALYQRNGWIKPNNDMQAAVGYPMGYSCSKARAHGLKAIKALHSVVRWATISKAFRTEIAGCFASHQFAALRCVTAAL